MGKNTKYSSLCQDIFKRFQLLMDYVFQIMRKVGFGCLFQLQVEKRMQSKDITGTRKHMAS